MLPLRTKATFPGVADEVITLPEIPLPADADIPSSSPGTGGGPPQPLPVPVPTPSASRTLFERYGSVPINNITGILPRNRANTPVPATHQKNQLVVHWEGPHIDRQVVDAEMVQRIVGIANFHIAKDWGNGQGGSGIMYHEVISPDGTVFVTRDYEEVLWHAGNDEANLWGRAILVYCARDMPPTEVQLFRLAQRVLDFRVPITPHSRWSPTECPGDQIRAYVAGL